MKRLITLAAAALSISTAGSQAQYGGGTVRIGVLSDMSGLYSDATGMGSVWAANRAVEDFAAAKKGMNVEVLFADHLNKPDVGLNIARKWIDTDKVDVIVDVPTSSVALAVNEAVRDKNKVFLPSGAGTSDLTGSSCSPNTVHWAYDTWALANGTANAIVKAGGDTWFFITADYAFGHALERDATAIVEANGGRVLGAVRHPFPGTDFSSFLLQAQASKAKIIGLANAGGDTRNAIKQATEFHILEGGQKLAGLLVVITDVHALGLQVAQGLVFTGPWYWDTSDDNRAFAAAFFSAFNRMPSYTIAGVYSAVFHYLKAIAALNTHADGAAVVAKMKAIPTEDKLFGKGSIREDGRKIHDMYLYEVKRPDEAKYPWDYLRVKATIPVAQAWRPLDQGNCSLVKRS